MQEQGPRYAKDIAHGPSASTLVRPVVDRGVDMAYLADELLSPDIIEALTIKGLSLAETEETEQAIALRHAGLTASMTHHALIGRPYESLHMSVGYTLDAFGKQANTFSLVLHNSFNSSVTEIIGASNDAGVLDTAVRQADTAESLGRQPSQVVDEAALQTLLRDFLLQTDYDQRQLQGEYSTTDLLQLLIGRSSKTKKACELIHSEGYMNDAGERKVHLQQSLTRVANRHEVKAINRQVKVSILSRQQLGAAAIGQPFPFSVIKLEFNATEGFKEAKDNFTKPTIVAGMGHVNPEQYPEDVRRQLLEGVYRKFADPAKFREAILGNLGRLAAVEAADIDL